jgi:hypothetical protein
LLRTASSTPYAAVGWTTLLKNCKRSSYMLDGMLLIYCFLHRKRWLDDSFIYVTYASTNVDNPSVEGGGYISFSACQAECSASSVCSGFVIDSADDYHCRLTSGLISSGSSLRSNHTQVVMKGKCFHFCRPTVALKYSLSSFFARLFAALYSSLIPKAFCVFDVVPDLCGNVQCEYGTCSMLTGQCMCYDGYTGSTCAIPPGTLCMNY